MNLNDIRLFLRVVETNSFTSAADSLGIQKSTISRRINQLEDELGVRLLQRTTRKLKLTEEGVELFNRCLPLINELELIPDQVTTHQDNLRGKLRITLPPEMALYMMNEIISSFIARYPNVEMEVELSTRLVDLIEDGVDLAMRVGTLADSSLIARKIASVKMGLYCTPEYAEKHGLPDTPSDLNLHTCLMNVRPADQWQIVVDGETMTTSLTPKMRANSVSFLREMVLQHHGIARMPTVFALSLLEENKLIPVLADFRLPDIDIHALYPTRRHLNPKVRLFIDHTVEMIAKHPWVYDKLLNIVE